MAVSAVNRSNDGSDATDATDARVADRAIDELAVRQHGVVARRQLLAAGLSAHTVDNRVKRGRLRAIHPGVYRVGPVPVPLQREMAAVLAGGDGAVLTGPSAGVVWGILPAARRPAEVEISVRDGFRGRVAGVRVRRVPTLRDDEVTERRGIPVTTPARTLLDLAGALAPRALEQALAAAEREELAELTDVAQLLERHPRRRGAASLRAILSRELGPAFTRSPLEERFLALVRSAGLPAPQVNAGVAGFEVDFLWRRQRVVVEIDGFRYHRGRQSFDRDHDRDLTLRAAGFTVLRFTAKQLDQQADDVLASLESALGRARGKGMLV